MPSAMYALAESVQSATATARSGRDWRNGANQKRLPVIFLLEEAAAKPFHDPIYCCLPLVHSGTSYRSLGDPKEIRLAFRKYSSDAPDFQSRLKPPLPIGFNLRPSDSVWTRIVSCKGFALRNGKGIGGKWWALAIPPQPTWKGEVGSRP
jgi:hypothetical protein